MRKFNHLLFWIIVVVVLTAAFGYSSSNYAEAFYFVSMLLPVIVGTSYFFNYYLVPKHLFEKAYFKFVLYVIYTLIISVYLEMLVMVMGLILLANYQYAAMNPVTTNVLLLTIVMYFIVFLNGFISLIKKSFMSQHQIDDLKLNKQKQDTGYLLVRTNRKTSKIRLDDISYIESLADYVRIMKEDGESIITKEKISAISEKLPDSFMRIHRSFIINTRAITSFTKENIVIKNHVLPISRTYKKSVEERLLSSQHTL